MAEIRQHGTKVELVDDKDDPQIAFGKGIVSPPDPVTDLVLYSGGVERARIVTDGTGTGLFSGSLPVVKASGDTSGATDAGVLADAITQHGGAQMQPNSAYYATAGVLALNQDGMTLAGTGRSTVLNIVGTAADGVKVGTGSTIIYAPVLKDFWLKGPGSGSGKGINMGLGGVVNGPKISNVKVSRFGSYGLYTTFTDYLIQTGVQLVSNLDHQWYAGQATNAGPALGCSFDWETAQFGAPPSGKAGLFGADLSGFVMFGGEFGGLEQGFIIPGGLGDNEGIAFKGVRWETLTVNHGKLGDGTTNFPLGVSFENCIFLGNNTITQLVLVQGAQYVTFRNCRGSQIPSGGCFVKGVSGAPSTDVNLRDSFVNSGAHVFTDSSSVNWDTRNIESSGDWTTLNAPPLLISEKLGDQAATKTIIVARVPRAMTIASVSLATENLITNSATDFWTFDVRRYVAGSNHGQIASQSTAGSFTLPALRGANLTLGADVSLTANDEIVIVVTPTGAPAALNGLVIGVAWQPA